MTNAGSAKAVALELGLRLYDQDVVAGSRRLVAERGSLTSEGGAPPPSGTSKPAAKPALGDEPALLRQLAEGDAVAFRRVLQRHLPQLLAIGRRMLRDDAEAEDVAQEAMLRLWRNAGSIEVGAGGLMPWLRRVVSNLCIDRIRAGRATNVTDEVPEQIQPATQQQGLDERDLAARVDRALKGLPERQRLALTMFHYEGLSQIEVGRTLGISDEAVESLLARARRTLRADLKDEWQHLLPDKEDGA